MNGTEDAKTAEIELHDKERKNKEVITVKEFIAFFECPVCLQYPDDDDVLLQCRNGHSGCQTCYSRLTACPVCRLTLQPLVKTISNEMLALMKQELRHLENPYDSIDLKSLLNFFKCFTCKFNPTRHPTWQCENGHLLCEVCRLDYNFCFKCNTDDIQTRSLIVQKIVGLISKPCRFVVSGCNATIKELNHHERDCKHRNIRCLFPDCDSNVSVNKLIEHLQSYNPTHLDFIIPIEPHQNKVNNQANGFFKLSELYDVSILETKSRYNFRKVSYLKLNDKIHFFFDCWACNYKRGAMFWLYYLGTPMEAEKFAFELRLFKDGSEKEIRVSGPAISVDTYYRRMMRNPRSFKISCAEIKQYWNQKEIALSWEVKVFENQSSQLNIIANKTP